MTQPALEVIEGGKGLGDRALLHDLYLKYGGMVFNRCQYLLKDLTQAEDAMQDVFAKVLNHGAQFRAQASPLTYLVKIATHHCLNLIRSQKAPWQEQLLRDQANRPVAYGGPSVLEQRDAVRKLLSQFDLETQTAAVHYYVDEMTLEEVAALLERSVPTIRKRLQQFALAGGQEFEP